LSHYPLKEVVVPPLGQTTDTVTLVAWYKQGGEAVKEGFGTESQNLLKF